MLGINIVVITRFVCVRVCSKTLLFIVKLHLSSKNKQQQQLKKKKKSKKKVECFSFNSTHTLVCMMYLYDYGMNRVISYDFYVWHFGCKLSKLESK